MRRVLGLGLGLRRGPRPHRAGVAAACDKALRDDASACDPASASTCDAALVHIALGHYRLRRGPASPSACDTALRRGLASLPPRTRPWPRPAMRPSSTSRWMRVEWRAWIYELGSLPPLMLVFAGREAGIEHRWNQHGLGGDNARPATAAATSAGAAAASLICGWRRRGHVRRWRRL
uniref:Uncharacterized protein n=1 Tax=Ananas comosus var. bracteatus TaxID=296719 RepID=A0A6V7PLH5_ANACO|nr:unnamed protein product [Ananas comosus var. bracteatus]